MWMMAVRSPFSIEGSIAELATSSIERRHMVEAGVYWEGGGP